MVLNRLNRLVTLNYAEHRSAKLCRIIWKILPDYVHDVTFQQTVLGNCSPDVRRLL